jgi:peptidoglycan hydrolase-like protein with peptidoglycan-binding domain
MDQVREWYDVASNKDRILFVQQKLAGMRRYKGELDGVMNNELKAAIAEYQAATDLIADGRITFDLYFSLKDDVQNELALVPIKPVKLSPVNPAIPIVMAPQAVAEPAPESAAAAAQVVPFQISMTSDKGANPSYKVGELLNMQMSLNRFGTAYCFYEDVGKNTARIFPNRFYRDTLIGANLQVPLPTGGFKIKFDKPGRERVGCVASDRELLVPPTLRDVKDLSPLPAGNLEQIVAQFKAINPVMIANIVDISIR